MASREQGNRVVVPSTQADLVDHAWKVGFNVNIRRDVNFEPDLRPTVTNHKERLIEREIGNASAGFVTAGIFKHGAPFDEVAQEEWPIAYR